MRVEVVNPPTQEPLSLDDAKAYLRVEHDLEDDLITSLIAGARRHVESVTRRSLAVQTLRVSFDAIPRARRVPLPRPPLLEVTTCAAVDQWGGADPIIDFVVDASHAPGTVRLPADIGARRLVVTYEAGYGGEGAEVIPQPLVLAMQYLVSHWYETRTPTSSGVSHPVEMTVDALCAPYIIRYRYPR